MAKHNRLIALLFGLLCQQTHSIYPDPLMCSLSQTPSRFCQYLDQTTNPTVQIPGYYFLEGGVEQFVKARLTPSQDLFDPNRNQLWEYRYEHIYFEGSIALTQYATAFLQVSTQTQNQIMTKSGAYTTEVIAINQFWQLPHSGVPDYDDLRTGSADPLINDFLRVPYTNPMIGPTYSDLPEQSTYQWFVGDIVPMQSCAYVVNMNSIGWAGTFKVAYSFQRIMMSIQYDYTLQSKKVMIVPDAPFIVAPAVPAYDDLPLNHQSGSRINYYWRWRAFYWFKNGMIHIKQDSSYIATNSPCNRATPVFNPAGATLVHYQRQIARNANSGTTIISHAFVYNGLYYVWDDGTSTGQQYVGRLEGTPEGGWANAAWNWFGLNQIQNHPYVSNSNNYIIQLASFEYFGLFIKLQYGLPPSPSGQMYFIEIEPDKIINKNADGTLKMLNAAAGTYSYSATPLSYDYLSATNTFGVRVRDDAKTIWCPTSTEFKFAQAQGEMYLSRPAYMVCQGKETTVFRVTTSINPFMVIPASNAMNAYTKLFSAVYQTQQFHMFATQPGNTDTTSTGCSPAAPCVTNKNLSSLQTWQSTEAIVVDLRKQDEVLRWPLATCGDGVQNTTSSGWEDCDYSKSVDTPITLTGAGTPTQNTYVYPAPTKTNTYGNYGTTLSVNGDNQRFTAPWPGYSTYTPALDPSKDNDLTRWSGEITIWYDPPTKAYYNCNNVCKRVQINLCGDGIPSNGRVKNGANFVKSPTNQQNGSDLQPGDAGYEQCDDGNNMPGDGCDANCQLEAGWECPRWGVACNKRCGNGWRDWEINSLGQVVSSSYTRASQMTATLGQMITGAEECDMGVWNVDDNGSLDPYTNQKNYYKSACNKDCMVTNKNLWSCSWKPDYADADGTTIIGYHSRCEYLLGNRVVNTVDNTPGMTVSETCDAGVQQWQAQEFIRGYRFPLYFGANKPGATNSMMYTGNYYFTGAVTPGTNFQVDGLGNAQIMQQWVDYRGATPVMSTATGYNTDKCNAGQVSPLNPDGTSNPYASCVGDTSAVIPIQDPKFPWNYPIAPVVGDPLYQHASYGPYVFYMQGYQGNRCNCCGGAAAGYSSTAAAGCPTACATCQCNKYGAFYQTNQCGQCQNLQSLNMNGPCGCPTGQTCGCAVSWYYVGILPNGPCPSSQNCPSPGCSYKGTNGLPLWCRSEQTNMNWQIGCDYTGQIINADNGNINPATGKPYAALFEPNPDGTYGGTYNPATGTSSGGAASPYPEFKCPATYTDTTQCTDRCGDGIYDGLVYFGDFQRSRSTQPYPTGVNGYTPRNPQFQFDYATRMPVEECDTGRTHGTGWDDALGSNPDGLYDATSTHGCDEQCNIVPGWTCSIFFYKMLRRSAKVPYGDDYTYQQGVGVEEPLFRSECWQSSTVSSEGPWRRLHPENFDPHGRFLHHLPRRGVYYNLPQTTNVFIDGALALSPKYGTNGQMRVIEMPCTTDPAYTCTTADYKAAVVFGYENLNFANNDFVQVSGTGINLKFDLTANSNALKGKQRNTFGQYLVVNENLNSISIYGYSSISPFTFQLLWTSDVETSVQFLGAHEFYWWPQNQFLLAKLSDGSSFKFFRLAANFQSMLAADSTLAWANRKQYTGFNLFHVNGQVTVPPVFDGNFIYMYTSTTSGGQMSAYYYNAARMDLDLVCQTTTQPEITNSYQLYSFAKIAGVGLVAHIPGLPQTFLLTCDPTTSVETWPTPFTTTTSLTYDFSLCANYFPSASPCGPQDARAAPIFCDTAGQTQVGLLTANVIFRQAREDPATFPVYNNTESALYQASPPIWAWFDNNYLFKLAYTSGKLQVVKSIEFIKGLNLLGVTATAKGNVYPEQLDIGNQFLAVMSPAQCGAKYAVTLITNPSVYLYDLSKNDVHDLVNCDCNFASLPDGLDDNSGCFPVYVNPQATPLVQQVSASTGWLAYTGGIAVPNPIPVPYAPWSCIDLPATEQTTVAWQLLV